MAYRPGYSQAQNQQMDSQYQGGNPPQSSWLDDIRWAATDDFNRASEPVLDWFGAGRDNYPDMQAYSNSVNAEQDAWEAQQSLKDKNIQYARDFRSGLPGQESKMLGQLGANESKSLSEALRTTRNNAASRGLINSGRRVGSEAKLRGESAGRMATGAQNIRRGLLTQADAFDKQAVQSGIDFQQSEQAIQDTIYQQALAEVNGYNSMMGSMAQAAATAAALYYTGGAAL